MHIAYSLTSKQYPQRSLEGPVDIAEGRSGVFISSGAAAEEQTQAKPSKAIELNDMSTE